MKTNDSIFYQEVSRTVDALRRGDTILYPTDTVWGIGCDATNIHAVNRIFTVKNRDREKSLIILLYSKEQLSQYLHNVPPFAHELLDGIEEPVTVIYNGARNLALNTIAADGSVAIRVTKHPFCEAVLRAFGKPIVSTSANISGEGTPLLFKDISDSVKQKVDYLVQLDHDVVENVKTSMIIRMFPDGQYKVIRK